MKKCLSLLVLLWVITGVQAQTTPKPWKPVNANYAFPRVIINASEVDSVKLSLSQGKNLSVYNSIYLSASAIPPLTNGDTTSKRTRAAIAKNAAFVYLLGVKPLLNSTTNLTPIESNLLKAKAITLLEEINPYVNKLTLDSPLNFTLWSYTARDLINYSEAYDMLLGAGVDSASMVNSREALKKLAGGLYFETGQTIAGTSFFQSTKNSSALQVAAAIGVAAVVLNDLTDTVDKYMPMSWINCAMWNIHNILFWDIRHQSDVKRMAGYAESPYLFKLAFCNVMPFMKAMGNFLPDTTVFYKFNQIDRKLRNPWYDSNYTKIFDWYAAIRMPNGAMPPVEATLTNQFFPELAIMRNQKYLWNNYFSKLDSLQYNTFDKQVTFVYDMRADYVAANMTPQNHIDSAMVAMPDAGIAVLRSGNDSNATYVAILGKNGNTLTVTDQYNQADDASFMMMVDGQPMMLDPGMFSDLPILRDTLARASNHNMIFVDGSATSAGIPSQPNGANTFIEKYFSTDVQQYVEVRTRYNDADISRGMMQVRKKYYLLTDHTSADAPHTYTMRLHGYGLMGGDTLFVGAFLDLTANNRAAWKRRGSGIYTYTNSDLPFFMSTATGRHEHTQYFLQNHTYTNANTSIPTSNMSYLTCFQTFRNLMTDTFPVITLNVDGALGYKIVDGANTDIAVSKSFGNSIQIGSATTGLSRGYRTNGQFVFLSENGGNLTECFVKKGSFWMDGNDTVWFAEKPINMEFLAVGPKTYKGYIGDTGMVHFYAKEYPYLITGDALWNVSYDATTKLTSVYFGRRGNFTLHVDDAKTGVADVEKLQMNLYPNPSNDRIHIQLSEFTPGTSMVEVVDLSGKLVYTQMLDGRTREADLSVNTLETGIYLVTVKHNGIALSRGMKLMVVH